MLNISLGVLIALGLLLFAYGVQKKSQLSMFFGGTAFLAPTFYLIDWIPLLPFVALIALAISYLVKKKGNPA